MCLNRTQFVKILTDSHSPWSVLAIRRSIGNSAQEFWTVQNFGHKFPHSKNRTKFLKHSWTWYWIVIDSEAFWGISCYVGNREIKPSNKTKEEIVEGFSLRLITPSRACESVLEVEQIWQILEHTGSVSNSWLVILPMANYHIFPSQRVRARASRL